MPQSLIIGIAGGSGSGKTWLAKRIQERFPAQSTLISHDWYYRDLSALPLQVASQSNFDQPDALETTLLIEHLDLLKNGHAVDAPDYDFARHMRRVGTRKLSPNPLIIVEGLFALENSQLRNRYSRSIFIDTPSDLRLIRRIRRDLTERGYELEDILKGWETHAMPMFESLVRPTAQFASTIWKSLVNKAFVEKFLSDLSRQMASHADDENQGIRQRDC